MVPLPLQLSSMRACFLLKNDCTIKPTALHDTVESNCAGFLPSKCGPPEKVPLALCAALATQSAMMQVADKEEISSVRIRALTN